MKRMTVLTGAFIVSLIANIYLLVTRASDSAERGAVSSSNPARSSRRGELPALSRVAPGPGEARPSADDDSAAREREATLTAQLLKAQAALDEHRPLNEHFQDSLERSPEMEEQATAALDKILATRPGQKRIYTVECHGATCLLKVDEDQETNVWMKTLQESDERDAFTRMQFGVAGTYLRVASPEELAGARYVESVFVVIRNSPAVAACKQRFPTPTGHVVLRVVLSASRDVRVTMEGKLADQAFGACLRPVLEQAPSQVPPPPATVQSLPGNVQIVSVPAAPRAPAAPQAPATPRAPDAPVERLPAREHLATKLTPLTH
jgi:hypothetical protein